MNDDARPQGSVDPDAALDPSDLAVLSEVAGMLDAVDPVPDGLVERLQFLDGRGLRRGGPDRSRARRRPHGAHRPWPTPPHRDAHVLYRTASRRW